jgi:D-alanyl-D-alanine carboxypeptidase
MEVDGTSRPAQRRPPRRRFVRLILAGMVAVTGVAACGGEKKRAEVSADLDVRLQKVLSGAVARPEAVFPGTALTITRPGLGTWSGAAGEGNIEPATPMRATDTFRAGSIIKPFVAAVILQLTEEGKFALDDRLPDVLPTTLTGRFANAGEITVRMLLNHTSGIPDYTNGGFEGLVAADPHRRWTVGEFLDRAAAQPPTGAPGERYAYSNTDYNLLGLVIEHATGAPWRAAVRTRIIERLDLENTSLPEPGDAAAAAGHVAHGYERMDGRLRDLTDVDPSMADAAGGHALVTTTKDLISFLHALLAGDLFERADTLHQMLTFVEATDSPGQVGYGLGIERYVLPGNLEVIGHVGTTAGYRAIVGHLPAEDVDVAMVITSPDDPTPVLLPALRLMIAKAP